MLEKARKWQKSKADFKCRHLYTKRQQRREQQNILSKDEERDIKMIQRMVQESGLTDTLFLVRPNIPGAQH